VFVCLFVCLLSIDAGVSLLLCSLCLFVCCSVLPADRGEQARDQQRPRPVRLQVRNSYSATKGGFVPPACPTQQQPIANRSTLRLCRVTVPPTVRMQPLRHNTVRCVATVDTCPAGSNGRNAPISTHAYCHTCRWMVDARSPRWAGDGWGFCDFLDHYRCDRQCGTPRALMPE
jgi:hypothetical protein